MEELSTTMKTLPLLLLWAALFISCNGDKKVNEYGYIFQESTGQNQYILIDGRKVPVKSFVADVSNQMALKSLQALKPGILYENRRGDRIFVRGEYDDQSQSFRLNHWTLKVPFEEVVVEDEMKLPHTTHKVTRQSLERTDFEVKNGFDPKDPAFDPKAYQQTQ